MRDELKPISKINANCTHVLVFHSSESVEKGIFYASTVTPWLFQFIRTLSL